MKKSIKALSALLSVLLFVPTSALAGNEGSGGGTVVRVAEGAKPVLLDLFLRDPNFKESENTDVIVENCGDLGPYNSEPQQQYGFSFVLGAPNWAYKYAYYQLSVWEQSSPVIVNWIQLAMASASLKITFGNIPQTDNFWVPTTFKKKFPSAKTDTAVFYHTLTGPIIGAKTWNELSIKSQAGLIIHEALREIQIAFGDQMSEKTLQEVTAKIMLDKPKAGETLDDPNLYGSFLGEKIRSYKPGEETSIIPVISQRIIERSMSFAAPENQDEVSKLLQFFKTNNKCVGAKTTN